MQQAAQAVDGPLASTVYARWQRQAGAPTISTVRHHLGPWDVALRRAGLTPRESPPREDLLAAVVTLAHELGRPPSAQDWHRWAPRPLSVDAARRLGGGTWRNVLDAARPTDATWPSRRSPSRAVQHLLSLPDDHLTPRERELAALFRAGHTLESAGARLGLTRERVRQVARLAGDPHAAHRPRWTQAALVAHLHRWPVAHGHRAPTIAEWTERNLHPSASLIIRRFGSWRAAWRAVAPDAQLPKPGRRPGS